MVIVLLFILLVLCILICCINCYCIYNKNNYNGGTYYSNAIHNNSNIWQENVKTAKELLDDEFKDLYNNDEKQIILDICSKELDYNIWNDLIDFSTLHHNSKNIYQYYYIRTYDKREYPYYPEYFLVQSCYFRKFFINRLQVLTEFYKLNSTILYIGAANSIFLPILIHLFPSYTWHIYEEFTISYELKTNKNVFFYNKKMDEFEAMQWVGKVDVCISDFRKPVQASTISLKKDKISLQERVESMMLDDVATNIKLIKIIKPAIGACIKFKAPYVDPSSKQTIELLKGKILWLPWSESTSTDGTLVINGYEIKHNTNMVLYLSVLQNSYSIHNRYYRPWGYYKTSLNYKNINGFCHCFDCVCELDTVSNYLKLNIQTQKDVINILNYQLEPLISIRNKQNYHGRFLSLLPAMRIKKISILQNIGIYASIDIKQKELYHKRLKEFSDKYDEFYLIPIDNVVKHGNVKHNNVKHDNFDLNIEKNLKTAKLLLDTKFKGLYSKEEEKIILYTSSKLFKIPTVWNDFKDMLQYRDDKAKLAHNYVYCHLGQRKLFMAELQLLTRFIPDINNLATILYIGAAAGYHLPLLLKLFPNTIWHLYDPSPFCNKLMELNLANNNRRIYLYNEFFTDDIATKWHNKCDFFISDIRLSANTRETFESQVESDMRMQERWTIAINPKLGASLKFRPPYLESTIKYFVYKYIRGQIMWQMWQPRNSTECRLIIDSIDIHNKMEFDVVKYQNSCAFHNIIDRAWKTYELPKYNDGSICDDLNKVIGYDRCFDCTCESVCWLQYMELKNVKKKKIHQYFDELTHITHQTLQNKKSMHGSNQFKFAANRLIL
jgi:hypothetical protein